MPRTYVCSFCGKNFLFNRGMTYVRNDGAILRFCSRKCRRSMTVFKRDPRKLKWTKQHFLKPKSQKKRV